MYVRSVDKTAMCVLTFMLFAIITACGASFKLLVITVVALYHRVLGCSGKAVKVEQPLHGVLPPCKDCFSHPLQAHVAMVLAVVSFAIPPIFEVFFFSLSAESL